VDTAPRTDRYALQQIAEITQIAQQTTFNGLNVLNGSSGNTTYQVGANVGNTITINLATGVGANQIGETATAAGTALAASANGIATTGATGALTVQVGTTQAVSVGASANYATAVAWQDGTSAYAKAGAFNAAGASGLTATATNSVTDAGFAGVTSAGGAGTYSLSINGVAVFGAVTVSSTISTSSIAAQINQVSSQVPSPQMIVPDGSQGIGSDLLFGGRPLFNALDRTKGYYAVQYDTFVGSYYDKTIVGDMLTDCEDRFISQSRDDFADGRYRNISFATIFPDGVRRLLAAALTEDAISLGWRVESKNGKAVAQDDGSPSAGMGFRSFWPKDGPEMCWRRSGSVICKQYPEAPGDTPIDASAPKESIAIDPEIGFEVQKFLAFHALKNLPESYKADFTDMMRIFKNIPGSTPLFPADEQATWVDPLSGQIYIAHRYGSETIDGQPVDRGIAARMLD